jgi:hypothetical protein
MEKFEGLKVVKKRRGEEVERLRIIQQAKVCAELG